MSDMLHRMTVRVPAGFHKRLKLAAVSEGRSIYSLLETLLDQHEQKMKATAAKMPSPLHRVAVDD